MAPTTFGDLIQLFGAGLLQGITSPYTWAVVLIAAVLVVACSRLGADTTTTATASTWTCPHGCGASGTCDPGTEQSAVDVHLGVFCAQAGDR